MATVMMPISMAAPQLATAIAPTHLIQTLSVPFAKDTDSLPAVVNVTPKVPVATHTAHDQQDKAISETRFAPTKNVCPNGYWPRLTCPVCRSKPIAANGLGTDVVTSTGKAYSEDVPGYATLFASEETQSRSIVSEEMEATHGPSFSKLKPQESCT